MKPVLVYAILGASLALSGTRVLAADAAQVLAGVRHTVFTVIASANDYGVVNVIGQGSAVLIAPGRLITSCSVIDNATGIAVSRAQDRIVEKVRLTQRDPDTGLCELGLLQQKAGFDRPAFVAPPGGLRSGAVVYTVGSPQGTDLTVESGSVTALREAATGQRFILLSTNLEPGLRGAGLFDENGRLVGVVSAAAQGTQIPGFAVASASIRLAGTTGSATSGTGTSGATPQASQPQSSQPVPSAPSAAAAPTITPTTAPTAAAPAASATAPIAAADKIPRDLTTRLAGSGDNSVVQRRYREMTARNELAGLDDADAIARVYAAVISDAVVAQMRWDEGGDHVAEFEVRLHRSGELMFSLPLRRSGLDSFDLAAQRAIGIASPYPVPRDDAAFEKLQSLVLTVRPPKRTAQSAPKPPAAQTAPKPAAAPAVRPRKP